MTHVPSQGTSRSGTVFYRSSILKLSVILSKKNISFCVFLLDFHTATTLTTLLAPNT